MTANQFNAECCSRTIDPQVALENDSVQDALLARDDEAVIVLLSSEF